jgi:uncharacterized protein
VTRRWLPIVVVLVAAAAMARSVASDFQIPPTPNHYVTDNANALSNATRVSLESELAAYEKSTGHQVIVWIGQTTGDVPLETWTTTTADHWKIGRRGKDDGAVLFLFMQDHKARIEVGYGLESSLTDADSYRIIQDDIVPRMRAGNVDGAVSSGVAAMLTTISPTYKGVAPPQPAETSTSGGVSGWVILGLVLIFIVFPIVLQLILISRLGHIITRNGARGAFLGGFSSFGGGGGGFGGGGFGGGFSAGGGGFGGGGASGGW